MILFMIVKKKEGMIFNKRGFLAAKSALTSMKLRVISGVSVGILRSLFAVCFSPFAFRFSLFRSVTLSPVTCHKKTTRYASGRGQRKTSGSGNNSAIGVTVFYSDFDLASSLAFFIIFDFRLAALFLWITLFFASLSRLEIT